MAVICTGWSGGLEGNKKKTFKYEISLVCDDDGNFILLFFFYSLKLYFDVSYSFPGVDNPAAHSKL